MKKQILSFIFLLSAFGSYAQFYADGTVISSTVSFKDINTNTYNLFTMTGAGKHVIIDLSATWCGPCWSYHQSKVLDHYFDKYGPNGTLAKDAEVFLYEVDNTTTMADLQGTGSSTTGNWITGTTHPICNESATGAMEGKFVNAASYGIPAVFVVCANKKLYELSTSMTNETSLRNYINSKCGLAPLSNNEIMDYGFSYEVYPNPSNTKAVVHLNLDIPNTVSCIVRNSLGQIVKSFPQTNAATGVKDLEINTSSFSNGLYFIDVQVGKRLIHTKLVVAH